MPFVLSGAKHFCRKVNQDGPLHPVLLSNCWLWTGYCFTDGYGGVMVNYKFMRVHRYSWMTHCGPILDGMVVCHRCDTPLCVNPEHLFLGTFADNKSDCVAKGRHARGEKHGESKLTDDEVRMIRSLYKKGIRGSGSTSIARKFGVSKPVILGIVNGVSWKHVLQNGG